MERQRMKMVVQKIKTTILAYSWGEHRHIVVVYAAALVIVDIVLRNP
jgi:hypothetical protein